MYSDIDLNRLRIFKEVVQSGSFSKAALNLSQPKSRISRQIAALEKDLGIQLIYRTTRQFQLTAAGNDLFVQAAPLLNQLRNTLDQVRTGSEELSGSIRLSVPDDIGISLMGQISREFLHMHPKIRIDLHVGSMIVDLVRDSFDLVVRVGKIRDSTMIQKKLGSVGLSFVASPSFIQKHGSMDNFESLHRLPFLAFSSHSSRSLGVKIRKDNTTLKLSLNPIFSTNNFFILREMALADVGFTALPPYLARDFIKTGSLISILPEWQTNGGPIQILMPQQKEIPIRIKRFVEFLSEQLKDYLN
ncbi:MAG: LysR family transcriptional regulator [Chitinophagaceae bacterium]|nr:LysR family transcriptional regulator [Oligoflexus sp.]